MDAENMLFDYVRKYGERAQQMIATEISLAIDSGNDRLALELDKMLQLLEMMPLKLSA
jgi:hypothetical protein